MYDLKTLARPVEAGDVFLDFPVDTAFRQNLHLSDLTQGKPAMLLLLRYYGCPLCQLDMHLLAQDIGKIRAAGGVLLVVLQSSVDTMRAQLGSEDALPYPVICDPEKRLYQALDVRPAAAQTDLLGPDFGAKLKKIQAFGYEHGAYEGDELQLPAAFALDRERRVTYVHYGKTADDTPDAEQIAAVLKDAAK